MKITWKCFTVYDAVNDEVLIIHNTKKSRKGDTQCMHMQGGSCMRFSLSIERERDGLCA